MWTALWWNSRPLQARQGQSDTLPLASSDHPIAAREVMSKAILAAISHLPQLRGSLRTTAQCLAYYADGTGRVQKAFSYLAKAMHVSLSTAKRHIPRLLELGIIEKTTTRLSRWRCGINSYQFVEWVLALVPKRADGSRTHQEQAKREKSSARAGEKPTLTEAGARWLATLHRQWPLEEQRL
jgi:hypothetical protein